MYKYGGPHRPFGSPNPFKSPELSGPHRPLGPHEPSRLPGPPELPKHPRPNRPFGPNMDLADLNSR